jgi:putative endonuclease
MTSSLRERVFQHKTGVNEGFTKKYKLDRLVYWESYTSVHRAIAREKEIKGWTRLKKIQLIVGVNPIWKDLALDLYPEMEEEVRRGKATLKSMEEAQRLATSKRNA